MLEMKLKFNSTVVDHFRSVRDIVTIFDAVKISLLVIKILHFTLAQLCPDDKNSFLGQTSKNLERQQNYFPVSQLCFSDTAIWSLRCLLHCTAFFQVQNPKNRLVSVCLRETCLLSTQHCSLHWMISVVLKLSNC